MGNEAMSYSVKSIRKQFAATGTFYTDIALARLLADTLAQYGVVDEVYDPTCGCGNLLSVFGDDVVKYGQEINPEQAEQARLNLTNAHIVTGDTLKAPAFMDRRFRFISANYPFSIKWEPAEDERWADAPCLPPPSKADYAFILHIVHMLAPDGVAAVLGFPGILYRGQREGKIREWLVRSNLIESVTHIEGGHFEDTKIATALVVFRKGRQEGAPVRFRDNEHKLEREVPIDEIADNGYTLSVSNYVVPEQPVKEVDPVALEQAARADVLRRVNAQLGFSAQAIELHHMLGLPPLPPLIGFIQDIENILNKYRTPHAQDVFAFGK